MAKKQRNGKIELYRFIFSVYVVLFHISRNTLPKYKLAVSTKLSLAAHGCMGVEFFFVLSGFLMGASLYRKVSSEQKDLLSGNSNHESKKLADDWCGFLKRKYLGIFSPHVIAFIILYPLYCVGKHFGVKGWIVTLVDNIPAFFLLQKTGLYHGAIVNSVEWYISSMLIAMAIWYPIARKWYHQVARYIAPITAILIIGHIYHVSGHITGSSNWQGFTFRCNLRAIAEIAIGLFLYEFTRRCMESDILKNRKKRLGLTLLELFPSCGSQVTHSADCRKPMKSGLSRQLWS